LMGLTAVTIFFTVSRTGVLALIIILALSIYKFKDKILVYFLVFAVFASTFLVIKNVVYSKRFAFVEDVGTLRQEDRYKLLLASIASFQKHPILGAGPGSIFTELNITMGTEKKLMKGHNEFFNILVENGILGLLAFLSICYLFMQKLFYLEKTFPDEKDKKLAKAFQIAFVALFLASMTASTIYENHVWFFVGLGLALQKILPKKIIRYTQIR
jgi:O-antigen ligase